MAEGSSSFEWRPALSGGVWQCTAEERHIASTEEAEALREGIGCPLAPLPEALFVANALELQRDGRTCLRIDTRSALQTWNNIQQADARRRGKEVSALDYDWTFAVPYDGVVSDHLRAERCTDALPMEELTRRDPILFFAAMPLYNDELHDAGTVEMSVKLRFMHRCFLILVRCFLRIDGKRAWLRDVRWVYVDGWRYLLKQVQVREVHMDTPNPLLDVLTRDAAPAPADAGASDLRPAAKIGFTADDMHAHLPVTSEESFRYYFPAA